MAIPTDAEAKATALRVLRGGDADAAMLAAFALVAFGGTLTGEEQAEADARLSAGAKHSDKGSALHALATLAKA